MPTETDETPCMWAADLVARLAATGTPADKLRPVRDAMAARWDGTTALEPGDPARHLSAAEALALLADRLGDAHGTVAKARALIETGRLQPKKRPAHPAELIPPPPRGAAPVAADRADGEGAQDRGGEVGTPGRAEHSPGVVDLSAAAPTVGPRPVEAPKPKAPPAPKPKAPPAPTGKPKAGPNKPPANTRAEGPPAAPPSPGPAEGPTGAPDPSPAPAEGPPNSGAADAPPG